MTGEFITPETKKILKALNIVPLVKQGDTLNNLLTQKFAYSGVT